MTNAIQKPGVTIVDGIEHPPATWHCSRCRTTATVPAFEMPLGWMELTIKVGVFEHGFNTSRRETKQLCSSCAVLWRGGPEDYCKPEAMALPTGEPAAPTSRRRTRIR